MESLDAMCIRQQDGCFATGRVEVLGRIWVVIWSPCGYSVVMLNGALGISWFFVSDFEG